MTECKLCNLLESIDQQEIIWYDSKRLAIAVLNPKLSPHLGRTAVVSKKHAVSLRELEPEEYVPLIEVTSLVQQGINYAFNPDDIWLFNKGQATGHFNIDIVPIYKRPVTFEGHVFHPEEDSSIMLRSYNKAPIMNTSLQDKIRKQIGVGIDYILG